MRLLQAALLFILIITPTLIYAPLERISGEAPEIDTAKPQRELVDVSYTIDRITESEGFVVFSLNGSDYRVHFYVLGSNESGKNVLFLTGYGWTAEDTIGFLKDSLRDISVGIIVIDPPGMGLSNGPQQNRTALLGDKENPYTSYFRRYAEFAYVVARAFHVSYVSGASLGGITTFLLGYYMGDELEAIIPTMAAGYRKYSLSRLEAINRFVRDPNAESLIRNFDPAVLAPYIEVKTIVIAGAEDEVFEPITFYRTAQRLPYLEALVYLPGVPHGAYKEYFDALRARIEKLIHGRDEIVKSEKFYIGAVYELSTSVPVNVFGMEIVTYYTEYGALYSEVSFYKAYRLAVLYLLIIALAVYFIRRSYNGYAHYASLLSFMPRVFSPDRFNTITIPVIPMFLTISALLLTLVVIRRWLSLAAYVPRLVLGGYLQILIFPSVFMLVFRLAYALESRFIRARFLHLCS